MLKKETIFKQLAQLGVDEVLIGAIRIGSSITNHLPNVLTISDIIKNYNSTDENEKKVEKLLINLIKILFPC